jgi:hypothetical protein
VDPIVKALKKGVRAIELDMWPNKKKIQVLHGKYVFHFPEPLPLTGSMD